MSHLALVRASADGKSLAKLKMTLAALQCSLSSESKSSCRLVPPHTDIPYVTAGIITKVQIYEILKRYLTVLLDLLRKLEASILFTNVM